jgi:hypothetical protein
MGDSGKFVAISYWLVNLFIYTIMLPAPGIFEADYTCWMWPSILKPFCVRGEGGIQLVKHEWMSDWILTQNIAVFVKSTFFGNNLCSQSFQSFSKLHLGFCT